MQATTPVNNAVLDGYLALANNLSAASKAALIGRLSAAAELKKADDNTAFRQAFGAFISD